MHVHRDFGLPPPALYGNTLDLSLPAEPKWAPLLVEAHIAFPTFFFLVAYCSCTVSLLLKASRTERIVTVTRTFSCS